MTIAIAGLSAILICVLADTWITVQHWRTTASELIETLQNESADADYLYDVAVAYYNRLAAINDMLGDSQ